MNENKKSVLSLDNESAKKFFLKRVNYFSCSLPPYYNLDFSCKKCTKSLLIFLKSDILGMVNNELNKEYKKRDTTNLFSAKKISCEP